MDISDLVAQKIQGKLSVVVRETVVSPPKKRKWLLPFIFFVIIALYGAMFYMMVNRHKEQSVASVQRVEKLVERVMPDYQKEIDSMKRDIVALERKQFLLGVIANQNSSAVVNSGTPETGIVRLTKEWFLDKMPSFLTLSNEEKERLKKEIQP